VQRLVDGNLGADPLKEITNQTGLWALRLLCITLTVTPIRRLTGWNAVVRFRRMLGLFAFFYGTVHFLIFIVADRLASLGFPSFAEWQTWKALAASIGEEILKRPYITVGMATFLILLSLAVTSNRFSVRRLGRRWQKLHRLVYVAAIGGVVHFWWLVKADVTLPRRWAVAVALLLGFRVWWAWRAKSPAVRSASPA